MAFTVIGLAGGAGVGKDTLVDRYLKPQYGFQPFGMADDLKVLLVGQGALTFEEAFLLPKSERVRKLLVYKAEGERLAVRENIWVDVARASLERLQHRYGLQRFVITDVRRPFEVDAIKQLGGKVIGVEAPARWAANDLTPEMREASPEMFGRDFDTYAPLFDAVLKNDPQNAATVGLQLAAILKDFGVIDAIDPAIKLGVTEPSYDSLYRRGTETLGASGGLQPLCLTCGPKNIVWMGPTTQMCARCQASYDRWNATTISRDVR